MDEPRTVTLAAVRQGARYKARPLDGIWATAPYLHNGSVPNLDALLQPAAKRPLSFSIGVKTFDPVQGGIPDRRSGFPTIQRQESGRHTDHRKLERGPRVRRELERRRTELAARVSEDALKKSWSLIDAGPTGRRRQVLTCGPLSHPSRDHAPSTSE